MKKPSYLIIIASSCQMYSGTGKVIFDWVRFAKEDFEFSFLMDFGVEANFKIAKDFCEENAIVLHSSPGLKLPGCGDPGIAILNDHLAANDYDFIECIAWANAATNLNAVASKKEASKLVYVPHSQPLWTFLGHEPCFMTSTAFKETLEASDFVFVDSPAESKLKAFENVRPERVHFVPLGVDTQRYREDTAIVAEPFQMLCVCDCREMRKRIDLLLAAFSSAYAVDNRMRLVLGGKDSNLVQIPVDIKNAVTTLGYVDELALIELYRKSSLFALLSDYEAFGLPIAEALCCGCPVLLNRLDILESLFSELPGVSFIDNKNTQAAANLMLKLASSGADRTAIARCAQDVFSFAATYGRRRDILLGLQ